MPVLTPERPLSPEEQDERYLPLLPELEAELAGANARAERMPYHGWPHHPFSVRDANLAIRETQLKAGVPGVPSEFVTVYDSLGHDDRLDEYIRLCQQGKKPAESAELYAVQTSSEPLVRRGVDDFTVAEIGWNIRGTEAGVLCATLGMLNLCFADLGGTSEDYKTVMKPGTEALRQERQIIEELEIDELEFGKGSLCHLSRYRYENLLVPKLLVQSPELMKRFIKMGFNLKLMTADLAIQSGMMSARGFARNLGPNVGRLFTRTVQQEIDLELPKDQAVS